MLHCTRSISLIVSIFRNLRTGKYYPASMREIFGEIRVGVAGRFSLIITFSLSCVASVPKDVPSRWWTRRGIVNEIPSYSLAIHSQPRFQNEIVDSTAGAFIYALPTSFPFRRAFVMPFRFFFFSFFFVQASEFSN